MHLWTMAALLLAICCEASRRTAGKRSRDSLKDGLNNKTDPFKLSADTSAKDLAKLKDCKALTAVELNKLLKAEACSGFKGECLNQFDVTDLDGSCWANVRPEELVKLDDARVKQITESNILTLNLAPQTLRAIAKRFETVKLPEDGLFTAYVTRSAELSSALLDTNNLTVIATFLTATNLPKLDAGLFRRLGKEVVAALNDDAFSKIDATQLSLIRADSFAGFKPSQITAIQPASFAKLNRRQVEMLRDDVWAKLSPAQAKSFGPAPQPPPIKAAKEEKKVQALEILDRRTFIRNHPCQAVRSKIPTPKSPTKSLLNEDKKPDEKSEMSADTQKAFCEYCEKIWTAVEDSSDNGASTLRIGGTGALVTAMSVLLVFLWFEN